MRVPSSVLLSTICIFLLLPSIIQCFLKTEKHMDMGKLNSKYDDPKAGLEVLIFMLW